MSRMNHDKIKMQKRIVKELEITDSERTWAPRSKYWERLPSGDYKGLSLPTLFFTDFPYFARLIESDILEEDPQSLLAKQAREIKYRAQHILSPEPDRNRCEFAIVVDRSGIFEAFIPVAKQRRNLPDLKPGSKIDFRVPELNMMRLFQYRTASLSGILLQER
jgi:hypothetical protein